MRMGVEERFTQKGLCLGENKAIKPEDVRTIIERSFWSVCFKQLVTFGIGFRICLRSYEPHEPLQERQ